MVFLVFLFAFASGFASLVYQILWAREFAVILGSTVHAISTVLAAFMGGLGIGSMQGRARLLGGQFEIHSEPGKGARIEVWVPLQPQ